MLRLYNFDALPEQINLAGGAVKCQASFVLSRQRRRIKIMSIRIEVLVMSVQIAAGILIPFLGTSLGAAMVFFLKKQISFSVQKALTGFAAGVMV
ncbi:MAG: hypothetical protein IJ174_01330, partial [Clostridia bacterium]|nr:hypothetical protein [Clostridia bacterium]